MTSDLPPTGGSQPPPEPSPAGPARSGSSGASGSGASGSGASGSGASGSGASGQLPPAPAGATASGPGPAGTDEFFNRIRSAGVTRPDDGRWVAGVAAGLARRWDIDPILIRGGFVALSIFGGVGVVLYGLSWLLLPQDDGRIHVQQAIRGDITAGFFGALLLSLAAIGGGGGSGPWHDGFWFGWAFPGGLILTAAVIFAIWWLANRHPDGGGSPTGATGWASGTTTEAPGTSPHGLPPVYGSPSITPAYPATGSAPTAWSGEGQQTTEAARQARKAAKAQAQAQRAVEAQELSRVAKARRARTGPSKPIVRLTLGVALLTAAAILVIGNANDWKEPVGLIATASALAVIAAGVIASGLSGRRASGLAGIGLLLTVATLAGVGAENAGVRAGQNFTVIGQEAWEPHSAEAAESQFNLGVGEATLWLTDPAILNGASTGDPLQVRARIGAGHLTVVVPESATTRLDLVIGAGEVSYPDGSSYRFNRREGNDSERQRLTTGPAGAPQMIVDIQQGAGQLDIRTTSGVSVTTIPGPSATGSPAPTPSVSPTATATATATPTN